MVDLTEGTEIGLEPAAGRGLDGPHEAAGQDDVTCLQSLTIGCKPLDKPEDSGDRIIQHTRAKAGFLDHSVPLHDSPDPAQVEGVDGVAPRPKYDPCIGGVVADGVGDDPGAARGGIGAQDAGILILQRRGDMGGGLQDIIAGGLRAAQVARHQKGDLGLHPWLDEPAFRNRRAIGEDHVVEQHSRIRRVDLQLFLHGARGETDLPADARSALRQLQGDKVRLHRIGLVQGHAGMGEREKADLPARRLGGQKGACSGSDLLGGHSPAPSSPTVLRSVGRPSAMTSITSPGVSQTGGSNLAPAPVGVPVTMMSPGARVVKVEI